jgi:hypothetical protein
MRKACPQLSIAELDWRVNCILGAQCVSLIYSERIGGFFGAEAAVDLGVAAEWIVHCLMRGIAAPGYLDPGHARSSRSLRAKSTEGRKPRSTAKPA